MNNFVGYGHIKNKQLYSAKAPGTQSADRFISSDIDPFKAIISRIYFSIGCGVYYLFIVFLSLVCLIWTLFKTRSNDGWFIAVEILVLMLVMADMMGRVYLMETYRYIRNWTNWIDIAVILVYTTTL